MAARSAPQASASTAETASTSSSGRESSCSPAFAAALTAKMEEGLRRQLFRSLTRIQRHLSRRDPQTLRRISQWYSKEAEAECGSSSGTPEPQAIAPRLNYRQKRMDQNEIDIAKLAYLEIPRGVATRSLLVPPQPAWLFADGPLPANPGAEPPGFRWLENSNVNNAEDCSRRITERELARQGLDRWVFLYFRVLRCSWESTVVEEKKSAPDINMYAEENIYKWTKRLRFKILRQVPVKVALCAFLTRLGLETNTGIVFCRDGFYGLMDVGNAFGDPTKTPCNQIGFNSSARYLNLKNGDSIYVNACSDSQRQMMEEAPRQDAPKKRRKSKRSEDGGEEGEYEFGADDSQLRMDPDDL